MDAIDGEDPPPTGRSISLDPKSTSSEVPNVNVEAGSSSGMSIASAPSRIEGIVEDEEEDSESDTSLSASLLEEVLDDAEDRPYYLQDQLDGVSAEEAKRLQSRLRKVGASKFIEETLSTGNYDVRKLVSAFGVRPNLALPDSWYLEALGICIQRELGRRQKLEKFNTIDDAVELLKTSKNVMVITGAGISTSLGIPDFRSKNTGFYSQLLARGFQEPEEVFDIHNFDEDPTIFYSLAKDILPVTDRCSLTHAFIKSLQDKQKLLTNYTQNIDNIEQFAGIDSTRLIQCHGSWATASCRECGFTVKGAEVFEDVRTGNVPRCTECPKQIQAAVPGKRKRGLANGHKSRKSGWSDDDDDDSDGQYDIKEPGVMKPGITFFHEQLPGTFFDRLTEHDQDLVDLVVVIGTSMKVSPVNQIPNFVPASVPHIYISRDPASHINFDISLIGYCDDVVAELARRAGWTIEHDHFDSTAKAQIEAYDESGAHWTVKIPGTMHTIEEKANPGV